jgi:hypothetical protein
MIVVAAKRSGVVVSKGSHLKKIEMKTNDSSESIKEYSKRKIVLNQICPE